MVLSRPIAYFIIVVIFLNLKTPTVYSKTANLWATEDLVFIAGYHEQCVCMCRPLRQQQHTFIYLWESSHAAAGPRVHLSLRLNWVDTQDFAV